MRVIAEARSRRPGNAIGRADTDDELIQRALTAYYRARIPPKVLPDKAARVELDDGREYVVLYQPAVRDGTLRVYRVRKYDGILKALKRYPRIPYAFD
jgi:hypothetical protein